MFRQSALKIARLITTTVGPAVVGGLAQHHHDQQHGQPAQGQREPPAQEARFSILNPLNKTGDRTVDELIAKFPKEDQRGLAENIQTAVNSKASV
jgi:hypothetical protein